MADPRFFTKSTPLSLETLSAKAVFSCTNQHTVFEDVSALHTASLKDISFLDNPKYLSALKNTKAGAVCISQKYKDAIPSGTQALITDTPYKTFAAISQQFYPDAPPTPSIHPSAVIDKTATIASTAEIAANVVIEAHVTIGEHTKIGANTVINKGVQIGDTCTIGANVTISHSIIGHSVVIYPGACIGQRGFGFAADKTGVTRVPQLGRVILEDHTEIGANTTVDRGAGPDTIIRKGAMIDNQVQIAHNVEIGAGCIIAAQAGISGSTKIGAYSMLGGQSGLTGHLNIGSGAKIAANSGVMRDIEDGGSVGGSPAMPIKKWLRITALLAKWEKTHGSGTRPGT